jgi:hypothetical protein
MLTTTRLLPAVAALALLVTAPACASGGAYPQRYPAGVRIAADREYDRGFRDGLRRGEQDGRRGRPYNVWAHGSYRNADNRIGRRDAAITVRAFREGFEAGYAQGYRRYARGGYYPPAARTYPGYPGAVGSRAGALGSPAFDNGYRDGFDEGLRDARRGDAYDPVRSRRYREGDRAYDRRYGTRTDYQRDYRAGFMRGYQDAFGR